MPTARGAWTEIKQNKTTNKWWGIIAATYSTIINNNIIITVNPMDVKVKDAQGLSGTAINWQRRSRCGGPSAKTERSNNQLVRGGNYQI